MLIGQGLAGPNDAVQVGFLRGEGGKDKEAGGWVGGMDAQRPVHVHTMRLVTIYTSLKSTVSGGTVIMS